MLKLKEMLKKYNITVKQIVIIVCALSALISILTIVLLKNKPDKTDELRKLAYTNTNSVVESDIQINFDELKKINPDIYAWIKIPNTRIDYPILQNGEEDFYLTHDYEKKESNTGALYTQCYNKDDFSDFNTVIYGHDMLNGSMFSDLHKFKKQNFFDENKFIYIYLPDKTLKYRIFSTYTYDDTHILLNYDFDEVAQRVAYLEKLYSGTFEGLYLEEPKVFAQDKMITLSTCLGVDDKRLIVQGVLLTEYNKNLDEPTNSED